MAKFSQTQQPKTRQGRPKGSANKRSLISQALHETALVKLTEAVSNGENWAILAVLDRTSPKTKPTATGAERELIQAQTRLTDLKALEISDLELRIAALEENQK